MIGLNVTTDTFNALKQRYHNGSISKIDEIRLVEELLLRSERWSACVADLRKRFDNARDTFILMLEDR